MEFVKTEPGADPIIVEGYFAASPEAVFRAWTDPDTVVKWFGPNPGSALSAEIELQIGGFWRIVLFDDGETTMGFEGRYLEIEHNRRLVLSWAKFTDNVSQVPMVRQMSRVEINLEPNGDGTDMRVVHSAIEDPELRIGFSGGWQHGLENLQSLLNASMTG